MKYQHLFFDLDRTLWDFESNSGQTLHEIFLRFEIGAKTGILPDDFINNYRLINHGMWEAYRKGKIGKETLRNGRFHRTLLQHGIDDQSLAGQMGDYYIQYSPEKTGLLPYVHETLEVLQEKYRLHIITNGFEEVQHIKLNQSKLSTYFKQVITSEQAGHKKPDERIFSYALKKAGAAAKESLMIGDDLFTDIMGAKKAGLDQVYYNPEKNPHSEKITFEITCLSELPGLLS